MCTNGKRAGHSVRNRIVLTESGIENAYIIFLLLLYVRVACAPSLVTQRRVVRVCLRTVVIIIRGPHTFGRGGTTSAGGGAGHDPVECSTLRGVTSVSHSRMYPLHQQVNRLGRQPVTPFSQQPPPPEKLQICTTFGGFSHQFVADEILSFRPAEIIGSAKFWRYHFPNRVYNVRATINENQTIAD